MFSFFKKYSLLGVLFFGIFLGVIAFSSDAWAGCCSLAAHCGYANCAGTCPTGQCPGMVGACNLPDASCASGLACGTTGPCYCSADFCSTGDGGDGGDGGCTSPCGSCFDCNVCQTYGNGDFLVDQSFLASLPPLEEIGSSSQVPLGCAQIYTAAIVGGGIIPGEMVNASVASWQEQVEEEVWSLWIRQNLWVITGLLLASFVLLVLGYQVLQHPSHKS